MRIRSITIENFRGYKNTTNVQFDNITLVVGKNDVGKSTIFEALDIFFGNRKADKNDLNIHCNADDKISISVEFDNLPQEIDIDEGAKTNLKSEFLLNRNSYLEVKKLFNPNSPTTPPKISVICEYPKDKQNLLTLKNSELKALAASAKIEDSKYNKSINNSIRRAIWDAEELELTTTELEIDKEDGKKIYSKIEEEMPLYTLFSADRKNSDQDSEIQDPIKNSVKEIVKELSDKLDPIKKDILERIDKITQGTIEKLKEMNPEVADSLRPVSEKPAWEKAFNVTIESDGVPLNKRGSGVKRLVLINFFREEAERRKKEKAKNNIFYAIEEPETSQHPDWQKKLFEAFDELSADGSTQIGLTTHHPELAGLVNLPNIRLIEKTNEGIKVKQGAETNFKEIANTLGVLPKIDGVKVCFCLEGPNDIKFFQGIAKVFEVDSNSEKILWLSMGGETLKDYVTSGCLDVLNVPQIHFYDQEADQKYKDSVEELKKKGHWAKLTNCISTENYLHPTIYKKIWPELTSEFVDLKQKECFQNWSSRNIPQELNEFIKKEFEGGNTKLKNYGCGNIKKSFANYACDMTEDLFKELNLYDEINELFCELKKHI